MVKCKKFSELLLQIANTLWTFFCKNVLELLLLLPICHLVSLKSVINDSKGILLAIRKGVFATSLSVCDLEGGLATVSLFSQGVSCNLP